MRIATWNVEWFNTLFDRDGALKTGEEPSGRSGVTAGERVEAIAHVLRALDADAVMVVEAPDISRRRDGRAMLERFAAEAGLRARRALIGFPNDTRQEIALLHDPDAMEARHDPREAEDAPRFDRALDVTLDGREEQARFSKPPLEALCRSARGEWRLIGVHTKAKAPRDEGSPEPMRGVVESRRKLLAQCVWIRRRVEAHLAAGEPLIVLGDLNDDPALDALEAHHGHSGVETVTGEGAGRLRDAHLEAALAAGPGGGPTTARFRLPGEDRWMEALLDYALVSPDLAARGPVWRVWHPLKAPCAGNPALARALLTASDHFPVSIDVDL